MGTGPSYLESLSESLAVCFLLHTSATSGLAVTGRGAALSFTAKSRLTPVRVEPCTALFREDVHVSIHFDPVRMHGLSGEAPLKSS